MFEWLDKHIDGSLSLVELGAGQFDKIQRGPQKIPKIGIERHLPCIAKWAKDAQNVKAIHGDMRDFDKLIPKDFPRDTALMLDTLEHIDHKSGEKMLKDLQKTFRKILVFTPDGKHEQTDDPWGVGNIYNKHVSEWHTPELQALGFETVVDPNYHRNPDGSVKGGAIFAVWERK